MDSKDDEDTLLRDAADTASTTSGEMLDKSEVPQFQSLQSPPHEVATRPRAQRRLRGSIAEKLGRGPAQKPVPVKIDALKASRQKAKLHAAQAAPHMVAPLGPVWERAVDTRRNAIYYWEHLSGKSSWQPPPMHEGWWERLYDEKSRTGPRSSSQSAVICGDFVASARAQVANSSGTQLRR